MSINVDPDIEAIKKSFTDEQKAVYDKMFADPNKLKADWSMSRMIYNDMMKVVNDPATGPKVRLLLMNLTKYWSGRKLLMETLLKSTGNKELLDSWKQEELTKQKKGGK